MPSESIVEQIKENLMKNIPKQDISFMVDKVAEFQELVSWIELGYYLKVPISIDWNLDDKDGIEDAKMKVFEKWLDTNATWQSLITALLSVQYAHFDDEILQKIDSR